jgi:hypothetical protein
MKQSLPAKGFITEDSKKMALGNFFHPGSGKTTLRIVNSLHLINNLEWFSEKARP